MNHLRFGLRRFWRSAPQESTRDSPGSISSPTLPRSMCQPGVAAAAAGNGGGCCRAGARGDVLQDVHVQEGRSEGAGEPNEDELR